MIRSIPLPWKLAAVAAAAFLFVPGSRGPLLLAIAVGLGAAEAKRAHAVRGPSIELLIDGQVRRLPPEGGTVRLGGVEVEVARVDGQVSIDGQLVAVGDVVFQGSSLLEVLR